MSKLKSAPKTFVFLAGAHMDQIMRLEGPPIAGVSNPAKVETIPGGSALNSASVASALGLDVTLVSPIGSDASGQYLSLVCEKRGIRPALKTCAQHSTGIYSAIIEPGGEIVIGASDLGIYDAITDEWLKDNLSGVDGLFLNSNLGEAELLIAASHGTYLAAAAISPAKAFRLKPILSKLDVLFTNRREAAVLSGRGEEYGSRLAEWFIGKGVRSGTISNGSDDLIFWSDSHISQIPSQKVKPIVDVNGAGDALAGATLAGLADGLPFEAAVKLGNAAAAFSLSHSGPYSGLLSIEKLKEFL